jgi:hypothetical protein
VRIPIFEDERKSANALREGLETKHYGLDPTTTLALKSSVRSLQVEQVWQSEVTTVRVDFVPCPGTIRKSTLLRK